MNKLTQHIMRLSEAAKKTNNTILNHANKYVNEKENTAGKSSMKEL